MIEKIGIIKKTSKKNRHGSTGLSSRQGAKTQRNVQISNQKWNPAMRPGHPADPSAALGMTGGRDLRYRRCDNCFFSVWLIVPNRPVLMCMQRENKVGRWWGVQLEQSCRNFYPSGTFKAGSEAARRIPLTRGKFALVDAEDYYQLSKFQWYAKYSGSTFYAARNHAGKSVKMHREILASPDHLLVDHIDRNGLNNRKSNLRFCTSSQNLCNTVSIRGSSSRYKGVCWHKREKQWVASIQFNKKSYYLGDFDNEIDAAKAYDKKAKVLHGQFACLNLPDQ